MIPVDRSHDTEGPGPSRAFIAQSSGHDNDFSPAHAAILKVALVFVGTAGIVAWLVLALGHIDDRYRIGHVQGHWMALARYANEAMLYPPLSVGVRFGGTRHMPLPILANAGAARLTGEYLMSGKAVAVVLFAALLALVFVALRQMRCPWPLAVALTGLLPATTTGVLAGSAIGGDLLAVVLQMGVVLAMTAALRSDSQNWLIAAAILAGLAVCSKLTGHWGALAVLSWLGLRRDWRRFAWFATICGATAASTLAMVLWASEGRFFTNFLTLTFAGTGGPVAWFRAPSQLIFFGAGDTLAVWMLGPFAALGALCAWRSSALTIHHHALAWSLLLTLAVFTDIGAGLNQLLDPAVLTLVAVGHLASTLAPDRPSAPPLATALALTVIWAGVTGVRGLVPDLREVVAAVRTGVTLPKYNPRPLADVVDSGDTLLAEDPSIPVLLGQTPVVLDPFMLRRLGEVQPETVNRLIARIERREFDHVATINSLDDDEFWWRHYHFGMRVVRALRETYVFVGIADGYYLYEPKRR